MPSQNDGRISGRLPTMAEGVQTYVTPEPVMVGDLSATGRAIHWGTMLAAVSVMIGIVVGVGSIIGVVGKAFYVEREEYNRAVVHQAEDKVKSDETFKRIDSSLARLEASLQKLSDSVEALRAEKERRR